MVDREDIRELVPHYVAMVVLVLVVLNGIRIAFGQQHFLVEFGIILVLVLGYRPLVVRIDAIPSPDIWETIENR